MTLPLKHSDNGCGNHIWLLSVEYHFGYAYITKYLPGLLPISCLNYATFFFISWRNQFMGISKPGNKISTGWLVNFRLPWVAIFVLPSVSVVWQHFTMFMIDPLRLNEKYPYWLLQVSTLCCQEQTLVSSHIHTRLIQQYIQSDNPQIAITCIWQFKGVLINSEKVCDSDHWWCSYLLFPTAGAISTCWGIQVTTYPDIINENFVSHGAEIWPSNRHFGHVDPV